VNRIVITGASQGIGLAIAKLFHTRGWSVIIASRNEKKLKEICAQFPGMEYQKVDFSSKPESVSFARKFSVTYGPPDILVNNAGIFKPGTIQDESDELFEELISLNLNSAYYVTKNLLPAMKENGRGLIVNMCSVASIKAYPNGSSYAISKHALLGFSRALREELKSTGIRVTAIIAGATWTPSWETSGFAEDKMIPAEDIASVIWNTWNLSPRTVPEEIVLRPILGDL